MTNMSSESSLGRACSESHFRVSPFTIRGRNGASSTVAHAGRPWRSTGGPCDVRILRLVLQAVDVPPAVHLRAAGQDQGRYATATLQHELGDRIQSMPDQLHQKVRWRRPVASRGETLAQIQVPPNALERLHLAKHIVRVPGYVLFESGQPVAHALHSVDEKKL